MPISYPESPVSIGDHIRKKRMELKLLQKDVARICGVGEDCITNWEKNRNTPQIQYYPRISNFLGYLPFDVDLTSLSGKLKAHRNINGLSQKQLGKIVGVDGATVCSWELEENKPHKAILAKLDMMFNHYQYPSLQLKDTMTCPAAMEKNPIVLDIKKPSVVHIPWFETTN